MTRTFLNFTRFFYPAHGYEWTVREAGEDMRDLIVTLTIVNETRNCPRLRRY